MASARTRPTRRAAASGSEDNTIRVWDLSKGDAAMRTLKGIPTMCTRCARWAHGAPLAECGHAGVVAAARALANTAVVVQPWLW